MQWALIVIQLLPYVFKSIEIVERLFADAPKAGEQKKNLVMATVKASTEDAPVEVRQKVEAAMNDFVDARSQFRFPHAVYEK